MEYRVALVAFDGLAIPGWVTYQLTTNGVELSSKECETDADLFAAAADADAVWVFGGSRILTADGLRALPRCSAILRTGSGVDNIPVETATEAGIVVASTPAAAAEPVSEHTAALILAALRQVVAQDRLVHAGVWDRNRAWPRWQLEGQTLGLVGFGVIARALVRKLSGFGLEVLAYDPFLSDAVFEDYGVRRVNHLDELLRSARIVSLHCPLTTETHHLLGDNEFGMMREGAILVNTARGALVDEAALLHALRGARLAGAALDVLEQEPAESGNPLLQLDNVIVTPHIAGYSDKYYDDTWSLSVETLVDLARGWWPQVCVNRHTVVPRRRLVERPPPP